MRNDVHKLQGGVPRSSSSSGRNKGFFLSSLRAISSYLKIISSGASSVASTVRSASASIMSSISDRDGDSNGYHLSYIINEFLKPVEGESYYGGRGCGRGGRGFRGGYEGILPINNVSAPKIEDPGSTIYWICTSHVSVLLFGPGLAQGSWNANLRGNQVWDYMELGGAYFADMDCIVAFERGMRTWAKWVDMNVDATKFWIWEYRLCLCAGTLDGREGWMF